MAQQSIFAGIDVGGTNVKFGLFEEGGRVVHREHRPTQADKGPKPLIHLISNIAERLLYMAAEDELTVAHLGVGTPGAVEFASGKIIGPSPNIPGWQGTELGSLLRERLNTPVFVDNDANCVALAESRSGAAYGSQSVVCVTIGTGIGGGIVLGGHLWRGATHSAAELGHVVIDPEGPMCGCGRKGCIEAFCSSRAITGRALAKMKGGLTPAFAALLSGGDDRLTIRKLFAAHKKGDEVARVTLEETARFLGIGLAGIVNFLNPETVVIGGGVAEAGGGFVEMVAAEIRKRAFESAVEELKIVRATLGNDAGFIGAGMLGVGRV